MRKELAKTYDPHGLEDRIYRTWEEKGYFHAEADDSKKPFTIVIPPPNITGVLHMGHAFDNTMQDVLIRFKRMQGYNALWQPGTDHASISTEVRIIEELAKEGIKKEDLGREKFLERAWEWKKQYGGTIISQLKKLGSSCDWARERFTMDEGCNRAVTEVFVRMHKKGYIYQGSRIINWCPHCNTSISDAEVDYEEQNGHLWHIRYPLIEEDGSVSKTQFLEFATTRPETMLGDTAVAVHPDDERYKDLIGKMVLLPFMNREIPVIADEYVDKEFGTGVVKITPAHDPNDFEVGKRHDLPIINVMNDDATINSNGGPYEGMERYEARKKIVADLDAQGLLVKIEEHEHAVGTHDRCGTTVEPMVKPQWFVAMEELAKPAIKAIETGELRFVPDRFDKTYLHWLENIRDWCISRQLWWGHRIPAWYCDDCGEVVVCKTKDAPAVCPKCGGAMHQDEDNLDTWFSSALWPFSTLGWPEHTPEYDYFYPTDVLVTGYDIIFFWVVRMVFSGYAHTGKSPFHTVLIHGLIRDDHGRKMSKSLGNGIDPLEVIDKYGADALRLTIITGNAPGNDMRFYWERVENSRNFANKVWNASRFIMMNLDGVTVTAPAEEDLTTPDKWILSALNSVAKDVTENMDKYELGIAVQKIYDFIWDEFCDWYIEIVKPRIYQKEDASAKNAALWTLRTVLSQALKLLHPFMPFITEEIYLSLLPEEETIMLAEYPAFREDLSFPAEEAAMGHIKDLVRGVRQIRTEMDVPNSKKAALHIVSKDAFVRDTFTALSNVYAGLAFASDVAVSEQEDINTDEAVSVVIPDATVYMPLADLVDKDKERMRLLKEKERLEKELARSKGMLSNERFLGKAPAQKVEEEKAKQKKYEQMMGDVVARLEQLV